MKNPKRPVAIVTGASRGLGLATARALAKSKWSLVIDAREPTALERAAGTIGSEVVAIPGDVTDATHREQLIGAALDNGGLHLLVNNASLLGPSPQPNLGSYPLDVLRQVYEVNVLAPLALIQSSLPILRRTRGAIVNVTSDAGSEAFAGWGGYGSSKASLDQLTRVLAVEEPDLSIYSFDPGDMNTRMHQEAVPGEDISDRPDPEDSVPSLLSLIEGRPESGRYRAADSMVAS